jgi:hypothetical protein
MVFFQNCRAGGVGRQPEGDARGTGCVRRDALPREIQRMELSFLGGGSLFRDEMWSIAN